MYKNIARGDAGGKQDLLLGKPIQRPEPLQFLLPPVGDFLERQLPAYPAEMPHVLAVKEFPDDKPKLRPQPSEEGLFVETPVSFDGKLLQL